MTTREETEELAKESGLEPALLFMLPGDQVFARLTRLIDLVKVKENEACAMLCERIWPSTKTSGHEWSDGFSDGTCDCADAIRARMKP